MFNANLALYSNHDCDFRCGFRPPFLFGFEEEKCIHVCIFCINKLSNTQKYNIDHITHNMTV